MLICIKIDSDLTDVASLITRYCIYNSETRDIDVYDSTRIIQLLQKQDVKHLRLKKNQLTYRDEILIDDNIFYINASGNFYLDTSTIDDVDMIFTRNETLIIYKNELYSIQSFGSHTHNIEQIDEDNFNIIVESTHALLWVVKIDGKLDIRVYNSVIFIISRYKLTLDTLNTEVRIPRIFAVKKQIEPLLFEIEHVFSKRRFLYNADTRKYLSLKQKILLSDEEAYNRYMEKGFKIHIPLLKPYLDSIYNTIRERLMTQLQTYYFKRFFWRSSPYIHHCDEVNNVLSMLLSYEYRDELSVIEDIIGVTGVVLHIHSQFYGQLLMLKCCPMIQVGTYSYDLIDDFDCEVARFFNESVYFREAKQE